MLVDPIVAQAIHELRSMRLRLDQLIMQLEARVVQVATGKCPHLDRSNITTMGSKGVSEMCRKCGTTLLDGNEVDMQALEIAPPTQERRD